MENHVLYSDKNIIVINKKPGDDSEKLWKENKFYFPDKNCVDIYPVNRLDMPVSGCIMGGLTKSALQVYGTLFKENKIRKEYWAICKKNGVPPDLFSGTCVDYIDYDNKRKKAFIVPGSDKGKKAVVNWEIIGWSENYLFFKLLPQTGKTHQLRLQLSNMGYPVRGDLKYGSRRSDTIPGIRLHCYSMEFPVMPEGNLITVKAMPPVLDNLWNCFLNFYNGTKDEK